MIGLENFIWSNQFNPKIIEMYSIDLLKKSFSNDSKIDKQYTFNLIIEKNRENCIALLSLNKEEFLKQLKDKDNQDSLLLFYLLINEETEKIFQQYPSHVRFETPEACYEASEKLALYAKQKFQAAEKAELWSIFFKFRETFPIADFRKNTSEIFKFYMFLLLMGKLATRAYRLLQKPIEQNEMNAFHHGSLGLTHEGLSQELTKEVQISLNFYFLHYLLQSENELISKLSDLSYYPSRVNLGTNESCMLNLVDFNKSIIRTYNDQQGTPRKCPLLDTIIVYSNIRYCHGILIFDETRNIFYAAHISPTIFNSSSSSNPPFEYPKDTYEDLLDFIGESANHKLHLFVFDAKGGTITKENLVEFVKKKLSSIFFTSCSYLSIDYGYGAYNDAGDSSGLNLVINPSKNTLMVAIRDDNSVEPIKIPLKHLMKLKDEIKEFGYSSDLYPLHAIVNQNGKLVFKQDHSDLAKSEAIVSKRLW